MEQEYDAVDICMGTRQISNADIVQRPPDMHKGTNLFRALPYIFTSQDQDHRDFCGSMVICLKQESAIEKAQAQVPTDGGNLRGVQHAPESGLGEGKLMIAP